MRLRPEIQLAVECASPRPDVARIRALLTENLNWDEVLRFVAEQRLQQIFVWRLREVQPSAIPPGLTGMFEASLRNSMLLTRELVRVIDLFRANGIDAMPFKGPSLALEAYGNLAMRSFDDLDIFLRAQDVWRARDVLAGAGFIPKVSLNPARQAAFLRSYDEFLLRGPGGSPLVELHWGFAPPHFSLRLGFDECWKRRGRTKLANRELPLLAASDLVLVLAVHGAKHGWSYFGLVTDFAWLIASHDLNWPKVLADAGERGILRILLVAVALASATFAIEPDAASAAALKADPAAGILASETMDAIFGFNGRQRHDERAILASARLHMRMRERLRDRIRYAVRLTTRPGIEDWQAIDLPPSLGFLYPVLRLPRLVAKYRPRASS